MPKTSSYEKLRDKWVKRHRTLSKRLLTRHKDSIEWLKTHSKQLAVGSAASAILLTSPVGSTLGPQQASSFQTTEQIGRETFLVSDLSKLVPQEVRELTPIEEEKLANALSRDFGVDVKVGINGIRLNRTYGMIGQEQHLARFPQDTMDTHFDNAKDAALYAREGMAPGLGAWRYFANSQAEMTEEDKLREKYYIAVPTFIAPGFNTHVAEYRDFFKYRKMILVNPDNGKAIIADIGDSGPAEWTGKHLGGSPEVMAYLERVDRTRVLYFFVDDKNNKIPLGPIKLVK
ncbi:MAG TPA: hypothetical protein VKC89_00830 [Patescibacteria group bacterium]|nr:hypothetical protein [Patescibacteria group bacterium]